MPQPLRFRSIQFRATSHLVAGLNSYPDQVCTTVGSISGKTKLARVGVLDGLGHPAVSREPSSRSGVDGLSLLRVLFECSMPSAHLSEEVANAARPVSAQRLLAATCRSAQDISTQRGPPMRHLACKLLLSCRGCCRALRERAPQVGFWVAKRWKSQQRLL